jgi:tyrosine-protein phosphatase YwqE
MGDHYTNTFDSIKNAYDLLVAELEKAQIEFKIGFAAEYYIDESFSQKLINKEPLICLKDNYVLVETSYINKPINFKEVIFELQMAGYKPVLAHPERYVYLYHDYKQFKEIHDLGVLFQINLNSICGHYSPKCRKIVQKLIDDKLVDFIGTDCHNMRHIEVLKRVMKEKYTKKLSSLNLLNNSLA